MPVSGGNALDSGTGTANEGTRPEQGEGWLIATAPEQCHFQIDLNGGWESVAGRTPSIHGSMRRLCYLGGISLWLSVVATVATRVPRRQEPARENHRNGASIGITVCLLGLM